MAGGRTGKLFFLEGAATWLMEARKEEGEGGKGNVALSVFHCVGKLAKTNDAFVRSPLVARVK